MNLVKSLVKWWRGQSLEVAKQLEEPVRDGKVAIADSERQLMKFRQAAIDLAAKTEILEKNRANILIYIDQMDQVANQAAKDKDDYTLKLAVSRKLADELSVKTLDEVIRQNGILVEQFQNQFNVAITKLQSAKVNLVSLAARQESARISQLMGEAVGPLQSEQPGLASLDNLEKSVEEAEAKAKAIKNFQSPVINIEEHLNEMAITTEMDRYKNNAAG